MSSDLMMHGKLPGFVFESLFMNQKEAKFPSHKKFMNKVG